MQALLDAEDEPGARALLFDLIDSDSIGPELGQLNGSASEPKQLRSLHG
jgi:hypothetical protein